MKNNKEKINQTTWSLSFEWIRKEDGQRKQVENIEIVRLAMVSFLEHYTEDSIVFQHETKPLTIYFKFILFLHFQKSRK